MKTPTMVRVGALALAAAVAAPLTAQQFPTTPPPIGAPKAFKVPVRRTFTLPNGMKVSLTPFGIVPKATVRLAIRTGAIDEAASELWVSGLMTDLMAEGTATRGARELAEEMAGMGGALGVNAGDDLTNIQADVLSERAADLVRVIADVARHPKFPESELPRMKQNRLRNIAIARSQSGTQAAVKFGEMMFGDHPYGRSFPTEAQLQGYTIDQVKAFWAANVGAGRAHLYVTGVFDAAAVEKAIRETFGDWAAGPAPTNNPAVMNTRKQVAVIDRPNAVQSTVLVGLPVPPMTSPDFIKLRVTDAILGGSFGSRITSNIREKKGYTYSPGSFISTRRGAAYWAENADVTTNVTGPSLTEIFAEVDRLRTEAPPASELDGIKKNMAGIFVIQNGSRVGVTGQFAAMDLQGMSDEFLRTYVDMVLAVTPADVQQMMQQYLTAEKMSLVVVGDRKIIDEQLKSITSTVP
jgi:zinc protease